MNKIMFVTNDAWFFKSHRLPIARALVANGWQVVVVARHDDTVSDIQDVGCVFASWNVSPRGKSLLGELSAFLSLARIIQREKPDVIHLVTIKPVLYGGMLSRFMNVPACVYAVSGLGSVFLTQTLNARLMRSFIKPFYRFAVGHSNAVLIFQNEDDRQLLLEQLSTPNLVTRLIRGSGVDVTQFPRSAEPTGTPVVTLAARLLKDKGIIEFVEAATILKDRGIDVVFQIAGGNVADGNSAAFTQQELKQLHDDKSIFMLGHSDNIPKLFKESNIVVLPSYREGLPKVLVEAAAAGRAVITTDVPGCRDAVTADQTALLVPARNSILLAEAILTLLDDPAHRAALGEAGRQLVASHMSIDIIVNNHLKIYDDLIP